KGETAAGAGTVGSAIGIVRASPAVDDLAVDERRAAAGDDEITLRLPVMGNGALKCVRRRTGHLFSARGGLRSGLSIASTTGSLGIATPGGTLGVTAARRSLPDRHHVLLGAMDDAQFHAPAVADVDN